MTGHELATMISLMDIVESWYAKIDRQLSSRQPLKTEDGSRRKLFPWNDRICKTSDDVLSTAE